MKGNNIIFLNTATMIEIVQYWLDNKFLNKDESAPRVTNVCVSSPLRELSDMFKVEIASKDDQL